MGAQATLNDKCGIRKDCLEEAALASSCPWTGEDQNCDDGPLAIASFPVSETPALLT